MQDLLLLIILSVSLGLMPAFIASRKGRSFLRWWVYGALAFVIAMPHALLIGMGNPMRGWGYKTCGFCRRKVSVKASHCPRCGHEFIDF